MRDAQEKGMTRPVKGPVKAIYRQGEWVVVDRNGITIIVPCYHRSASVARFIAVAMNEKLEREKK